MTNSNRRLLVLREEDFKDPHMYGDILDLLGLSYRDEVEIWIEEAVIPPLRTK
jgi:hypothetical protein